MPTPPRLPARRTLFALTLLLACGTTAGVAAAAPAQPLDTELAGRHTLVWAPPESADGRQPLLLFSHGYGGCAGQSRALLQALAEAGFWVAAPDHRDARCGGAHASEPFSLRDFRSPQDWTEASHADRRDDMLALLAALRQDPRFAPHIDFARLGLVGHSLGGYTALALAGAWPGWRMAQVKAVLAWSPYSAPFNLRHTLAGMQVPVMFQGGTRDAGITPSLGKGAGSYAQSRAPKYYVELEGAGHFAWTELNHRYDATITAYSVAFLSHYVKGSAADPVLTRLRDDVARLDFDSELGQGQFSRVDAAAAASPGQPSR